MNLKSVKPVNQSGSSLLKTFLYIYEYLTTKKCIEIIYSVSVKNSTEKFTYQL